MAHTRYSPLKAEKEILPIRNTRSRYSSKLTCSAAILSALILLGWFWTGDDLHFERSKEHGGLHKPVINGFKAPKKNIWADLDDDEVEDVLKFLYTVPNDLNLTKVDKAGP